VQSVLRKGKCQLDPVVAQKVSAMTADLLPSREISNSELLSQLPIARHLLMSRRSLELEVVFNDVLMVGLLRNFRNSVTWMVVFQCCIMNLVLSQRCLKVNLVSNSLQACFICIFCGRELFFLIFQLFFRHSQRFFQNISLAIFCLDTVFDFLFELVALLAPHFEIVKIPLRSNLLLRNSS
jgi:hypothetical protein